MDFGICRAPCNQFPLDTEGPLYFPYSWNKSHKRDSVSALAFQRAGLVASISFKGMEVCEVKQACSSLDHPQPSLYLPKPCLSLEGSRIPPESKRLPPTVFHHHQGSDSRQQSSTRCVKVPAAGVHAWLGHSRWRNCRVSEGSLVCVFSPLPPCTFAFPQAKSQSSSCSFSPPSFAVVSVLDFGHSNRSHVVVSR